MTAAPPTHSAPTLRIAVRAAGGLVIRRGADGGIRVALVHRSAGEDWSFPTGGQRRGESLLATALREVRAKTGFLCVAEAVVGVTEYLDHCGRPKLVRYWAMQHVSGGFLPNGEVDAIAWLRPSEAALQLTHDHDRELLDAAITHLEVVLERQEGMRSLSLG
jgi:8-oxo-dGTP diphosphatase